MGNKNKGKENRFCIGRRYTKGGMIFDIIMSFLIAVMCSGNLYRTDKVLGITVLIIVFSIAFIIFGRFIAEDYWLVEDRKIYYFPRLYPYRRLFLILFFKSEKHLLEKIDLNEIVSARIAWKEVTTLRYGIPMPVCLLMIYTETGEEIGFNVALDRSGTAITGKAIQYLQSEGLLIEGASEAFINCLFDPNQRLYDYYMGLEKIKY